MVHNQSFQKDLFGNMNLSYNNLIYRTRLL